VGREQSYPLASGSLTVALVFASISSKGLSCSPSETMDCCAMARGADAYYDRLIGGAVVRD